MAEFLKAPQFHENHTVTEVEIRRRGIHPELDAQRPPFLQPYSQTPREFLLAIKVHCTFSHDRELAFDLFVSLRVCHRCPISSGRPLASDCARSLDRFPSQRRVADLAHVNFLALLLPPGKGKTGTPERSG